MLGGSHASIIGLTSMHHPLKFPTPVPRFRAQPIRIDWYTQCQLVSTAQFTFTCRLQRFAAVTFTLLSPVFHAPLLHPRHSPSLLRPLLTLGRRHSVDVTRLAVIPVASARQARPPSS